MKTRLLSLLLVLALCLSVALVPALADGPQVVRSPQTVLVDGEKTDFEVYNIDGSNYFKLRDIAYVLNGTGSQFAVGFDAASNTITVQTGEAYEANGSEMQNGEDKSATAVTSSQTLQINGKAESLKAYNLGGNNFFQLRALGEALGFDVDYDAESNCVLIVSAALVPAVEVSTMDEFYAAVDGNGETNIQAKDLTVEGYLFIPEGVTLTVSGTLTIAVGSSGENRGTLNAGTIVFKACQDYSGMDVDLEGDTGYNSSFTNYGTAAVDQVIMESTADPGVELTGDITWKFNPMFFNEGQLTVKNADLQAGQFFFIESFENDSWENWIVPEFRTGYWEGDDWDGDGVQDSNEGILTTITGKATVGAHGNLPVCSNVTVAQGGSIVLEDSACINIDPEGVLTIAEGGSLTMAGTNLNNNGGTVNVDGSLIVTDGKITGIKPYVNEYGDIELEQTGRTWIWNNGTINVGGAMKIGNASGLHNCGELNISGELTCSPVSTRLSGYVSVAEDGKVSVVMGDWDEAKGDEYTDEQGVCWFFRNRDDSPYILNEGTITVTGILAADSIENNAYLNEGDESSPAHIAGNILVKQGGLFRVASWMGNWMGRDDQKNSWFGATLTIEQGAVMELKKDENSPAYPFFQSSGNVYIYGDMTADKYTELQIYNDALTDEAGEPISFANGVFQVDGSFSMTDTPILYFEDGYPVNADRTRFFNNGEMVINGTFSNAGGLFFNNIKLTINAGGRLVMESLPIEPAIDVDGDGVNEVFSAFLYNDGIITAEGTIQLVDKDAEIINYPDSVFEVTGTLDNNGTISEGSYEE